MGILEQPQTEKQLFLTGDYKIKELYFTINSTENLESNINLFVTTDPNVKANTYSVENINSSTDTVNWTLQPLSASDSKLVWNPKDGYSDPTAFAITGNINANTELTIDIILSPNGNTKDNIYVNSSSCLISEGRILPSANVAISTIDKIISGTVWHDNNKNGIMEPSEEKLSNIIVELLYEDGSPVLDSSNTPITAKTDENGKYIFNSLNKNNYLIKINTNNYYSVTVKNDSVSNSNKFNENKKTDIIEDLNTDGSAEVMNINAGLYVTKTNINIIKKWTNEPTLENGNKYVEKRPDYITLELYQKGITTPIKDYKLYSNPDINSDWIYTFNNLDMYDLSGNLIEYSILEKPIDFYTCTQQTNGTDVVLTNSFTVPTDTININVSKIWEDNQNVANKRPEKIKLNLYGNGTLVKDVTIQGDANTNNNWNYTFETLAKYDTFGNEITYTVVEKEVNKNDLKFYTLTTFGNQSDGFKITNTFTNRPEDKIDLTVVKVWNDYIEDKNYSTNRPTSIKVFVKDGSGKIVAEQIINKDYKTSDSNTWTYTFKNLSKYDELGNEIQYTIDEAETSDNSLLLYNKTIDNHVIMNTFKITEDTLTSSITKESKKETIFSKNENVDYTINYSASIDKYIGSATVTIVDTLPYEIDLSKSSLDGGSYNEANKTITWIEKVENIDTYKTNSPESISLQKNLNLVYKNYTFTGKTHKLDNNVSAKIVLNTTNKEEIKTASEKVLINLQSGKVITNHYLQGTTTKLTDSTIQDGVVGDSYTTTANQDLLKNYNLVAEPANKDGILTREDQVVNYYYTKKDGTVLIKYIEQDTGKELTNTIKYTNPIGTEYTSESKKFDYYKLINVPKNSSGKYTEELQEVIYYYEKLPFNLSVSKSVNKIILNGIEQVNYSDLAKIELDKKNLSSTDLKIKYKIIVKNTGEITGSCILAENIPTGFKMEENLNKKWKISGNSAYIKVENLEPEKESAYEVILTWDNSSKKMGTLTNTVELSNIENEANFDDINSLDNKDSAEFILSIKTGSRILLIISLILLTFTSFGIYLTITKYDVL